MKDFWDFYENMDELVYAADLDSHELVYMNRRAREVYGISSPEEVYGQICYKLLQGNSAPCAMCSDPKLKPGEFYEWTYHNSMLGKTFALKDTIVEKNGRRYRMEFGTDITMQEKQLKTIHDYASSTSLVTEALRVSLSAHTPERSLDTLMQYLGQSLDCERIYIFERTDQKTFNNTYEWCAETASPQKETLQDVPYELVAAWHIKFQEGQNVIIPDIQELKLKFPLTYDCLAHQNVHSLVVSPLIFNKEIIGFFGVDNPPQELITPISIMFEVLGHFIVSILRRRDLVNRLETLSYCDPLTGAKNRHAMNDFIATVQHHQSIGLVYCDVMGLKKVNDTLGHLEGDALLVHAYQCLLKYFSKDSIFRIGGDEFLIMCSNCQEEVLRSQMNALRSDMKNYDLTMAFGFVWRSKCDGQITNLLKEADRLMYEDKRSYYESTDTYR